MLKKHFKLGAATLAVSIALTGPSLAQKSDATAAETRQTEQVGAQLSDFTLAPQLSPQAGLNGDYGNLDAFWGNLDAFYGNLDAFYGNLDAFWGNLDAFYGNLDAFYGNLDAFWGNLDAFYGNLDAFYGSLDAFYGSLDAFGGESEPDLRALFDQAERSFGAAVQGQTGQSFHDAVVSSLLKKYGIEWEEGEFKAEDLAREQYAALMLELHDRLMTFTGLDHVDHWMSAVNWTPALSQSANGGKGVVVGLLDTPIKSSNLIGGAVREAQGFGLSSVDHGAGVASILAGAHDGQGVMGVAPEADFLVYNPFDASFTASWDDVKAGIRELSFLSDASIINMSLGVKGYTLHPDWKNVFYDFGAGLGTIDTLLVKSAGNSGVAQSVDVDFGMSDAFRRLIVVGSVDAGGTISDFSNRPGDACLIYWGKCRDGGRLMDRFLVAPGELILVQDNAGNLTRVSGTSLAAPQVAGAAALVQSRWEWLQNFPAETADILLESATDLGAPGTDAVYGRGLLNVEAALAPLDPNALYVETKSGRINVNDVGGLSTDMLGLVSADATITAFETIGWTRRDFEIPVESLSLEANIGADDPISASEQYLSTQLSAPAEAAPTTTEKKKKKKKKKIASFSNGLSLGGAAFGDLETPWHFSFAASRRDPNEIVEADAVPFQMGAEVTNNASGLTLRFGGGQGAFAFSNGSQFGMLSDHDISTGGVNPFLGLASGGFYAGAEMPLGERFSLAFGLTQDTDRQGFVDQETGEWRETFNGVADYQATALNMALGYDVSDALSVTLAYTQLNEATGLLGLQGSGAFALEGGAATDAITLSADAELGRGYALSVSATGGETRAGAFDQSVLSVDDGGIQSTAFQIAASKFGVFGEGDSVRASFAQPLHVEAGAIGVTTLQVIDRQTGETGFVSEALALDGASRRFVSEVLYATPVLNGAGSVSAFGQVELNNREFGFEQTAVSTGARFDFRF